MMKNLIKSDLSQLHPPWRPSLFNLGLMSHGCIRFPKSEMELLYLGAVLSSAKIPQARVPQSPKKAPYKLHAWLQQTSFGTPTPHMQSASPVTLLRMLTMPLNPASTMLAGSQPPLHVLNKSMTPPTLLSTSHALLWSGMSSSLQPTSSPAPPTPSFKTSPTLMEIDLDILTHLCWRGEDQSCSLQSGGCTQGGVFVSETSLYQPELSALGMVPMIQTKKLGFCLGGDLWKFHSQKK